MIRMGQTFSSIDIPQNSEPFARARTHLAHTLAHHRDLLAKHDEIITQVELDNQQRELSSTKKSRPPSRTSSLNTEAGILTAKLPYLYRRTIFKKKVKR